MQRFAKVPVKVGEFPSRLDGKPRFQANLVCRCTHPEDGYEVDGTVQGYGPTEEEAFADLLRNLGYEEAK